MVKFINAIIKVLRDWLDWIFIICLITFIYASRANPYFLPAWIHHPVGIAATIIVVILGTYLARKSTHSDIMSGLMLKLYFIVMPMILLLAMYGAMLSLTIMFASDPYTIKDLKFISCAQVHGKRGSHEFLYDQVSFASSNGKRIEMKLFAQDYDCAAARKLARQNSSVEIYGRTSVFGTYIEGYRFVSP